MVSYATASTRDGREAEGLNHGQEGAQRSGMKQKKNIKRTPKSSKKEKSPSETVSRIARSTAELSTNLKYISYVIAYSAAGPREERHRDIKEAARRRSGKTSIVVEDNNMKALGYFKKVMGGEGGDGQGAEAAEPARLERTPPSSYPPDKYKGNQTYPLSEGFLRDAYVRELAARCRQECNAEEGWSLARLGQWYWPHVLLQRRECVDCPRDFVKFFDGAVRLHELMCADPSVPKSGLWAERQEDCWRDVVDQLDNRYHASVSGFKHISGSDEASYALFLGKWDAKVREWKLNEKTNNSQPLFRGATKN